MNNYFYLNAFLFLIATLLTLRSHKQIALLLKVSSLSCYLGFSWDYFGIHMEAWHHRDPGPILMGVPTNELVLSFLMTYIAGWVLLQNLHAILHESSRQSDTEDRSDQCT